MTNEPETTGVTPSERYLGRLCKKTFLRFWSYPNVYRNQEWGAGRTGKEVCDLLVVFGDHILIFSDKHCAFPQASSIELSWCRWFKRAVYKSAQQIWGAERWIKEHPDRLFLDRECQEPFPIDLPNKATACIHRIVVANGAAADCIEHFREGNGSFMLKNTLTGADHLQPDSPEFAPFTIGNIEPSKGFVHVLNEPTLDILIRTLDTLADFVAYLDKKETLLASNTHVMAAGDEELLGYYLRKLNKEGQHDFLVSGDDAMYFDVGLWDEFQESPARKAQSEADQVSYAWDRLVEKFAYHIDTGTQDFTTQTGRRNNDILLRMVARESRFSRRVLAKNLLGIMERGNEHDKAARLGSSESTKTIYVFLSLKNLSFFPSLDAYRETRRELLYAHCAVAKLIRPEAVDIVGIATNPLREMGNGSEDLIYLDASDWTTERNAEAKKLRRDLGIFTTGREFRFFDNEYPNIALKEIKKGRNRNTACICGSGKKYKKCCGKRS